MPSEVRENTVVKAAVALAQTQLNQRRYFSFVVPATSLCLSLPQVRSLSLNPRVLTFNLNQCAFGAVPLGFTREGCDIRCRKSTTVITNCPRLKQLAIRCSGGHSHVALQGRARVGGRWQLRTALNEGFPPALVVAFARMVGDHL